MLSIKSVYRSYFPSKSPKEPTEDKSTQTDLWKPRPKLPATGPSPLQRLPLELLEEIASYLPACSELALSHTNKYFHTCFGPYHGVSLPDLVRDNPTDRLDFLSFLERDAECPKRSFTCSVCVERHPADRFSPTELRKDPKIRTCQRVWICEHRTLSLADYRDLLRALTDSKGVVLYPPSQQSASEISRYWRQCCPMAGRWFIRAGIGTEKRIMETSWGIPLTNLIAMGDALARGVNNEPAQLDFYLCPHSKLIENMANILAQRIGASLTKEPLQRASCTTCKALFWGYFGEGEFVVRSNRSLGDGRVDDPDWLSQVHLYNELLSFTPCS